jgi:serine phosphatase RsbU (regulator of sigma subunit)
MLEPQKPSLRLIRCISESLSAWASHVPILFLTTFLLLLPSILLLPLIIAATITGLTLMLLDAIESSPVRIRTVLRPFRHPVRFLVLSTASVVGYGLWFTILFFLFVAILPSSALPPPIVPEIELARSGIAKVLSPAVTKWLPAFQEAPHQWSVITPIVFLISVIEIEAGILALRCFYLPLIVIKRNIPIIDAYVESRNTVKRYGYIRHLLLLTLSIGLIVVPGMLLEDLPAQGIALVLLLPVSLGFVASAYLQTVGVEQANRELHDRQFVEMRDELQTAHDMQMGLLPEHPPELEHYFLDGLSVPANNVGGDYFDYRWLDEEKRRLAIVVADVSGKAMHAAVTALRFSEILRYECRGRTEPGPILDGLTEAIDEQTDDATFVTCCIAVLHVDTGRVEIANAGHCYPYQVGRKSKLAIPIEINGLPLGLPALIRPDKPYEALTIDLQPGDGLLLYSDGVVEAQNETGEMYEEDRLSDMLQRTLPTEGATSSIRSIYRSVEAFTGGASRTDDLTVVALKRVVPAGEFGRPQDPY